MQEEGTRVFRRVTKGGVEEELSVTGGVAVLRSPAGIRHRFRLQFPIKHVPTPLSHAFHGDKLGMDDNRPCGSSSGARRAAGGTRSASLARKSSSSTLRRGITLRRPCLSRCQALDILQGHVPFGFQLENVWETPQGLLLERRFSGATVEAMLR